MNTRRKGRLVAALAVVGLMSTPLVTVPAGATPAGDAVVINEVYTRGGSSGAPYTHKFVELHNPTGQDIVLDGMTVAYFSQSGTNANNPTTLSGTIKANGYYLIQGGSNGAAGEALPTPDQISNLNPGATGSIVLFSGAPVPLSSGDVAGKEGVLDAVGLKGAGIKESASFDVDVQTGNNKSAQRSNGIDTDNNAADFSAAAPTPVAGSTDPGGGTDPTDPPTDPPAGEKVSIADVQGTGNTSPLVGKTVTTEGFVTARYPEGGKNGVYIQTAGTGGTTSHEAPSVALFVYDGSAALPKGVAIGDFVEITGVVSEFNGSTQITASSWKKVDADALAAPQAVTLDRLPGDEAGKEALEGMLVDFSGPVTVTDNYQNGVEYGEIAAAFGNEPLRQASDLFNPTRDGYAALEAVDADNASRSIVIDDGRTSNWKSITNPNRNSVSLPYISATEPVRTGASVTFVQPAVVEYSFNYWRLQPVEPATTEAGGNRGSDFFAFENDRPAMPEDVGGDISISGFNVLNYFTTTAEDARCSSVYKDRQGNPITANTCDTVRGAANAVNLERQQVKIVNAINTLDATVVSLEEIENSAKNGKDRDAALATLTDALNEADSSKNWKYVPSPSTGLPNLVDQDVIRTAFIYQADQVKVVGESKILNDQVNFSNAREPLAQEFVAIDGNGEEYGESFVTIVNHFKSKGSGTAAPDPWQGNANADRVKQANALGEWSNAQWPDTAVFIVGDLNAYSAEDPILKLGELGYTRVMEHMAEQTGDQTYLDLTTYQYQSKHGSLDQALGNTKALEMVNDATVYGINAPEAIALEYSRFNNYLDIYWDESQYRSSDHDPVKVGVNVVDDVAPVVVSPVAPSLEGDVVSIPVVEGVVYEVDGVAVSGSITLSESVPSIVVSAVPGEGFVFPDGVVSEWTFDFAGGSSAVPVPVVGANVFFADDWDQRVARTGTVIGDADQILSGDFDGDGVDTLVLRVGASYSFLESNRVGSESQMVTVGDVDSFAVIGDFDGDGLDDLALRGAGSNRFDVYFNDGGVVDVTPGESLTFGRAGDVAFAGDFDGDGKDTLGVRRGIQFFVKNSLVGGLADVSFMFGNAGDRPLVGDFTGSGVDTVAVERGSRVFVRHSLAGGSADVSVVFGRVSDERVVGDWFDQGMDTLAAYRR